MFYFWREATAALVPGFLCQSGRRHPENVSILSSLLVPESFCVFLDSIVSCDVTERDLPTLGCKTVRILLWIALSTFWTTGARIVRGENEWVKVIFKMKVNWLNRINIPKESGITANRKTAATKGTGNIIMALLDCSQREWYGASD